MTSKDDDTLPLPGFLEELSVDVTADEDFIPTSQPQSCGNSKMSKNSDSSVGKSQEESKSPNATSDSRIEDTLPPEAVIDQSTIDRDKSSDFIPDTETKQTKVSYPNEEMSCKKKLPILGPEDLMGTLSSSLWEADVSKIPESPALETQNFYSINDSLVKSLPLNQEFVKMCEDSITEIIVNDSSETVDLETTPLKATASKCEIDVESLPVSVSSGSFGDKGEETQIFENSVLLLDQPKTSELHKSEKLSGVNSEKLYLQDTIEDREDSQPIGLNISPPVAPVPSEKPVKEEAKLPKVNGNTSPELEGHSSVVQTETGSSFQMRKIEMNLSATCLISFNPKTNKILQKIILNVKEIPRTKPKPKFQTKSIHLDHISDSDKSKRHSTSSSGSVYSDKTGLPFALPVRNSIVSDQTDSSEDDLALCRQKAKRAHTRMLWSNEYLLALKMDDMLQASLENNDLLKLPNAISPRKSLAISRDNGSEDVSEVPLSEETSLCSQESQIICNSEETPVEKKTEKEVEEKTEVLAPEKQTDTETTANENEEPETGQTKEKESLEVTLRDGLPVFARWTDKRYYSGTLSGDVKSERWEVRFDDGTVKTVREDFIMPTQWLRVGALVFALNDDQYESGQIVDVKRGDELNYVVELDTEKKKVSVKLSDLCLTDVMAGIIREKYKPVGGTPRGKADIDFDNVVSGKRIREQRTPLRPPDYVQSKSSGAKRKSSSKSKKDVLESIKETPQNTETTVRGLKSENGHLVEDKVISTDSPSGNEEGKTPLRGGARENRKKAKPRSLSYEAEETRSKKNLNTWLTPDGTPIPGSSGVKFKKQKTKNPETPVSERSVVTRSSKKSPSLVKEPDSMENSKRKRKFEDSIEDVQKKDKGKKKSKSKKG